MSTNRKTDPIKTVTKRDGSKVYRFTVDIGVDPVTGRRQQRRYTYPTKTQAKTERARIIAAVADGNHVPRSAVTFTDLSGTWRAAKAREVREVTMLTYRSGLAHAERAFGDVPAQRLTRIHVEGMVATMTETNLSGRSVAFSLMLVRAVLNEAMHDGLVTRNVAARVRPPAHTPKKRTALTSEEIAAVTEAAQESRLYAAWLLTLSGLRRSEVLGLRWEDIDLDSGTLTVAQGRVQVGGHRTVVGAPKTRRGHRTLPLPADLTAALRALRVRQVAERLAVGAGYPDTGLVAVNEEGTPIRPEAYSDAWRALCDAAGARSVTLHEARHSSVTSMRDRGVSDHVVAHWHGHDETVMRTVYSHALDASMVAAGDTLAAIRAGTGM